MRRVALIAAFREGLLLFGRRNDNGKWTLPGGHLEEGEDPVDGALRELKEETGLEPVGELKLIDERQRPHCKIYTYRCEVDGLPHGNNDPDDECSLWSFFDISEGVPTAVAENMTGPKDKEGNVVVDKFGLAKMAISDIALSNSGKTVNDKGLGTAQEHDYSHVLSPEARAQGYSIKLAHNTARAFYGPNGKAFAENDPNAVFQRFKSRAFHNGIQIGSVSAATGIPEYNSHQSIEPHSELDTEHHGKGIGTAMYEALYRHASGHGVTTVSGGYHSTDAKKVHARMSATHGLDYHPVLHSADEFGGKGSYEPYKYDIAPELNKAEVLAKGWGSAPRGFVSPEGQFNPVGEHEDHQDWIERKFPTGGYGHALNQGWMAVGIAGDHNVLAHPNFLGNPEHPATKAVREIAKKHWGNTFQNYVRGADTDPDLGTQEPWLDTAAFAHQGKLVAPNPFRKDEDLIKSVFSQTGFRHKTTGQIFPSGPFHDYSTAFEGNPDPELQQLSTEGNNLDEYGMVRDPAVEAGFLDHDGKFYTRQEASNKAFGATRSTGGDSDVLRQSGHMKKAEDEQELAKMAIAAIPRGAELGAHSDPKDPKDKGTVYDYSHVLTPEHRAKGYSLKVVHRPKSNFIKPEFRTDLYHKSNPKVPVSSVVGFRKKTGHLEPHVRTALPMSHRNQGLGVSMYEALYAHAKHNGVKYVQGGMHSNEAARVHQSLGRRHGMDYVRQDNAESPFDEGDPWEDEYPNAPYKYAIKDEMSMTKADSYEDVAQALMDDNHTRVANTFRDNPGVTEQHITEFLNRPDLAPRHAAAAFSAPAFGRNNLQQAYNVFSKMPPDFDRASHMSDIARYPQADDAMYRQLLNEGVDASLLQNKTLAPDIVNSIHEKLKQTAPALHGMAKHRLAGHPNLAPNHIAEIAAVAHNAHPQLHGDYENSYAAAANPSISQEMLRQILEKGKSLEAPARPDAKDPNINHTRLRMAAVRNPSLTPELADLAMQDPNILVPRTMFDKRIGSGYAAPGNDPVPGVGPQHVEQALARGDQNLATSAIQSSVAQPKHLLQFLNQYPTGTAWNNALQSPALTPEVTRHMVDNFGQIANTDTNWSSRGLLDRAAEDPELMRHLIHHPNLHNALADKLVHTVASGRNRNNLTPEDWASLLRHQNPTVSTQTADNNHLPPAVAEAEVAKGGLPVNVRAALAGSLTNPDTLHSLLTHTPSLDNVHATDYTDKMKELDAARGALPPDHEAHKWHNDFLATFDKKLGLDPKHRDNFMNWGRQAVPGSFTSVQAPGPAEDDVLSSLAANSNTSHEDQRKLSFHPEAGKYILQNENADPEILRDLYKQSVDNGDTDASFGRGERKKTHAGWLMDNNNTPGDVIHNIVAKDRTRVVGLRASQAVDHVNTSPETLRLIAANQDLPGTTRHHANEKLALHDPDSVHSQSVHMRAGTNKLRKIRDEILGHGVKEMQPKQLPAGDWSVGRNARGNIDADKLQQAIDATPAARYNVSHSDWDGAQRHNDDPSKVFQLNLTSDHVKKLKEAGVWDTFRKFHDATLQSGHPVTPSTLGWVRYTDNSGEDPSDDPNAPHEQRVQKWRKKLGNALDNNESELNDARDDLPDNELETCPDCEGSGQEPVRDEDGEVIDHEDCPTCDGGGQVHDENVSHTKENVDNDLYEFNQMVNGRGHHASGGHEAYLYWARQHVPGFAQGLDHPPSESPQAESPNQVPGTGKRRHVFIDEVQSDFGQSFSKQLGANARMQADKEADDQGMNAEERAAHHVNWQNRAKAETTEFSDDKYNKINKILFNGKKANEVLGESFLQHLRDKGHHDAKVQIHSVASKAPISLARPNEPAPGHFMHTYEEMPKKFGFEPSTYGQLDTQDNPDMKDQPTYEGTVRKSEELAKHDTPEFQKWFSGSTVSHPDGKPKRVYHGTSKDSDFSTFKMGKRGAWFTEDPEEASQYAETNDSQDVKFDHSTHQYVRTHQAPRVMPAYLSLKNPYILKPEDHAAMNVDGYARKQAQLFAQLKDKGHDGVNMGGGVHVAFHPHQIKSIFNERPTQDKAIHKAEPLTKMAIAAIPKGPLEEKTPEGTVHNYSHVLPAQHQKDFSIKVSHRPNDDRAYVANLYHNSAPDQPISSVAGIKVSKKSIEPHVIRDMPEPLRGKGLGRNLYEALYAHGLHTGVNTIEGSVHTNDAAGVHQSLSRIHGMDYQKEMLHPDYPDLPYPNADYSYAIKDEMSMSKAEEHDEVDRLLKHPNHLERRMALKLGTVQPKHLMRALGDEDPEVQRAAMEHPAMNSSVLMHLMDMPDREHLQLRALNHEGITKDHLQRLYDSHKDNKKLVNAITHHGKLDADMIDKLYEDGMGSRSLIANLNTSPDTIKKIIDKHWSKDHDQKSSHRYLVMEALKHPGVTPAAVSDALKNGDEGIKLAAASSPHLPSTAADDVMSRGTMGKNDEAYLRHALVSSKFATEKHLDMGLEDKHPRVRAGVFETKSDALLPKHVDRAIGRGEPLLAALAMKSKAALPEHAKKLLASKDPDLRIIGEHHDQASKEQVKKFQTDLGSWTSNFIKATKPEHFSSIIRASDDAGRQLVDHTPDLDVHPAEQTHLVQAYRNHVLNSSKTQKKLSARDSGGITRKHLYQIPDNVQSVGGQKFMVKPYHERIIRRIAAWGKNPHQGWAEMTNQGLYHAAGIGDLHQQVHVSEHDMGPGHEKEPALVVAMGKDHHSIYGTYKPESHMSPDMKGQAKKIAMMDFLSNNLDRHGGNLMIHKPVDGDADKLMAIDHSRSFQYRLPRAQRNAGSEKGRHAPLEDNFGDYVKDSSINSVDPLLGVTDMYGRPYDKDAHHKSMENYAPTFQWWGDQSKNVRAAMDKHLTQIKDPQVKAHIKRNFDERADWLDERANLGLENYGDTWHRDPVPMYRPNEMTDSEKDFHNWYSGNSNNLEPDVKQRWRDRGMGHIMDQVDKKG